MHEIIITELHFRNSPNHKNFSGDSRIFIISIVMSTIHGFMYAFLAFNMKRLPMKYILS